MAARGDGFSRHRCQRNFSGHPPGCATGPCMDALPMTAVALSWSDSPKLPRMAAWLVVLLVHGGLALWLLDSGRIELRSDDGPRILLRWSPPELPTPVAAAHLALRTDDAASVMPRPAPVAQADSAQPAAENAAAVAPLILSLPAGSIDGGDGISAAGVAPRLIGRREIHPAFAARRNYFPIRRQMTPSRSCMASRNCWVCGHRATSSTRASWASRTWTISRTPSKKPTATCCVRRCCR